MIDGKVPLILDVDPSPDVNYGQFVVGVFIADDTKQSISMMGMISDSFRLGRSQLNAIQLRMIE